MSGMCVAHTHAWHTNSNLSGLVCTQTDSNLEKMTASHSWVLNTQNAIKNMPNMIPIVYLNESLIYCNGNSVWKALKELYKNEHVDGGNSQFVQKLHQGEQPVNSLKKVENMYKFKEPKMCHVCRYALQGLYPQDSKH